MEQKGFDKNSLLAFFRRSYVHVAKEESVILHIPVWAAVIGTVLAPWLAVIGGVAAIALGYTISVKKDA